MMEGRDHSEYLRVANRSLGINVKKRNDRLCSRLGGGGGRKSKRLIPSNSHNPMNSVIAIKYSLE